MSVLLSEAKDPCDLHALPTAARFLSRTRALWVFVQLELFSRAPGQITH
jgi:hypothetical protein